MNAFRGTQRYGHREIEVLNLMEVYYYTSAQRKNGWIKKCLTFYVSGGQYQDR